MCWPDGSSVVVGLREQDRYPRGARLIGAPNRPVSVDHADHGAVGSAAARITELTYGVGAIGAIGASLPDSRQRV